LINCRNCIHWIEEDLENIESRSAGDSRLFSGCRLMGHVENSSAMPDCVHFVASENLFTICGTCRITVPKVCVSLGQCANCIDTDLFCVDYCLGGDQRKYCTHFVRLQTEGVHLVDQGQVFDLFPAAGLSGGPNQPQMRPPGKGKGREEPAQPQPPEGRRTDR